MVAQGDLCRFMLQSVNACTFPAGQSKRRSVLSKIGEPLLWKDVSRKQSIEMRMQEREKDSDDITYGLGSHPASARPAGPPAQDHGRPAAHAIRSENAAYSRTRGGAAR